MKGAGFGVLLALLAGCSLPEPTPEASADAQQALRWQQHLREVESLAEWELQGRFGLQWPDGQVQGNLQWRQEGGDFELQMSGPFGLKPVRMIGNVQTGQAVLYDGEEEFQGEIRALMRQRLGFSLPLEGLATLVRGIPISSEGPVMLDAQARAMRITHGGWDFAYEEYSCCETPTLPGRIRFTTDDLRGVLVVREWRRE